MSFSFKIAQRFKDWVVLGERTEEGRLLKFRASTQFEELKRELAAELETFEHQEITEDSLCGHFKILQYREGHRFSTDDVLVAWYASQQAPFAQRVLDLGSGIGSVAMLCAWRMPSARWVTLEAQAQSYFLAQQSVALNGLEDRFEVRWGDFREQILKIADFSQTQGTDQVHPLGFDLVTTSPPYFPLDSGHLSDHPQKVACRFEVRGDVSDYLRTAALALRPGGFVALVFPIDPAHQFQRVKGAALGSDLVILRWRPIVLREGEAPLLGLFILGRKRDYEKLEPWKEPELLIREKNGNTSLEYLQIKLSMGLPPTGRVIGR